MNRATTLCTLICSAAVLGSAALLTAGPLTPPSGPVASSYKTLSEVEPRIAINSTNTPGDSDTSPSLFKITQPGSYYLTTNVAGVAGKNGIEITASGVTVDLNGFDIVGVAGSLNGVVATVGGLEYIEVRNGSIRGWGGDGLALGGAGVDSSIVRDIRSSDNAGTGILAGPGTLVSGCVASSNAGAGIAASVICVVTGCSAFDNGGSGIVASTGSTITNCTSIANFAGGFVFGNACTIIGCSAEGNGSDGIDGSIAATITNCTSYNNTGNGISAGTGSAIRGCLSRFNALDGIRVSSGSVVLDNNCSSNGSTDGAGIHATGTDNRIERNNCLGADRGIDVDAVGNIIIRNTCSGNTINWSIVAGNHYGPIIDRTIVAAPPAVNGNAATEAIGSTHPDANFTY
ncbi:MAG: right-handed parallel beta-helix repeat-containing protein [Planctomycetota bacterium]|nr:right-handed parallel beta-helix repeat-containing protein [Planctomycetota bacterium]